MSTPPKTQPNTIAADHKALVEFVLEQAEAAPVARRVKVYRGLAQVIGSPQSAANLNALADRLAATDRLARQFTFEIENPNP